jgi:hypothetical protein
VNEDLLGTAAPRYADVVLLEFGMGVALLIGAVPACMRRFRRHAWCQSANVLLYQNVSHETFWQDGAESPLTSPAVLIESGFAGGQAKMAARLCALVQADSDRRSPRPVVAGRVRHTGAEFDADMTVNPLATGGFRDRRDARASLSRARSGLVAGLNLVGPRGFVRAKANSGGATAD